MANGRTSSKVRSGRPSLHRTQAEAQAAATSLLNRTRGGGEVIIHRPDGEIRDSNTINRKDPYPPKG
jgi:hypothetical protein